MDGSRFDHLTRSLASGASRRSFFKVLLGVGGAAAADRALPDGDAEAARRPTPTPKPPKCPGQQRWNGSACECPDGSSACGPACCNPGGVGATHSECCDNACCHGACYGEELCCPTGRLPLCASSGKGTECCPAGAECCSVDGCCMGTCYGGPGGDAFCCASGAACGDDCCDSATETCCGGGCCDGDCTPSGACCPAGVAVCQDACCEAGQVCAEDPQFPGNPFCCTPAHCGVNTCGLFQSGCFSIIDCGTCDGPGEECIGGACCVPNQDACAGKCGRTIDNCGRVLNCDDCPDGQICIPESNFCCQPATCGPNNCGFFQSGCNTIIDCGECAGAGEECIGGACCVPQPDEDACAGHCLRAINNCGAVVMCPDCPAGQQCLDDLTCCTPSTCAAELPSCGFIDLGCNTGVVRCDCPSDQVCVNGTCQQIVG